jgi:hypothetical protein
MGSEKPCRICASSSQECFKARILRKYDISYYLCETCGSLQTEEPYWLEEAYQSSINVSDTGGLLRSLSLAEITSILIYFFFDKNARFLDFAGGYGVFTRRMRDIGFDFYWMDRYSPNLFARGFEYTDDLGDIEVLTSFESFEHFENPIREIETILSFSKSIIFTTELLPYPVPKPDEWHYYGLYHGQHISFYSLKTLQFIANKYSLNLYNTYPVHILTEKSFSPIHLKLFLKLRRFGLFLYIKQKIKSRTVADSIELSKLNRFC